ncbi:T9SS type A sorting domain-containing protein [uncultured Nonlabens sp.]|uniref:T9SS type A sorting domain-containing protein n=1 Tax=uncultured Nonlabens sp. TaxID=859306 RepID=UPI00260897C6|nr:T9SS type A sorting domain-containing protein [uncultured Nonlabens sp.]
MKNIISLFLVSFAFQMATAQVWVKGDNFIYSKGTNIFVKNKINLDTDSKFYLREEAQLIQDDDVPNEGAGIISVFQEGTTNSYTYNYWSSPVSDQTTGTGNTGFLNSQIKYPTTAAGTNTDNTITADDSQILDFSIRDGESDDATIGGSPLKIAGRWLYTYESGGNPATGYAGWSIFNGAQNTPAGQGFTMKGVNEIAGGSANYNGGQRYDFRGRPNNGTINLQIGNDNATLAGNPYPSAIDLKRFIEVNAAHTSGNDVKMDPWVEFWESQVETSHLLTSYLGGYARYVPMGFNPGTENGYANSGTYLEPIFRRTDNDGNIITSGTSTSAGGITPPGTQTSYTGPGTDGRRRYAAIGQGFFISRTNTDIPFTATSFEQARTPFITAGSAVPSGLGETVEFNNSMRFFQKEDGNTSVFKSAPVNGNRLNSDAATQIPKMIINVVPNGLYARPLNFAFDNSTSQAYDYAWESPLSGRVDTDAYIKIGAQGEYGLSSQAFDENMAIPIGVEVGSSFTAPIDVEFELAFLINFDPNEVYLHDKTTEVYHDLKSGNKTLLIAPGHYTDRFEVTFKNTSSALSNEIEDTNFDIFQNNGSKELTILNPNLEDVANIALYDLAGRQIFSNKPASTEGSYSFETASLSSAIYIAKVTTVKNKEIAIKVSISN